VFIAITEFVHEDFVAIAEIFGSIVTVKKKDRRPTSSKLFYFEFASFWYETRT
jgi:hypothetical protein